MWVKVATNPLGRVHVSYSKAMGRLSRLYTGT
jgi:hypothetical protein